MKAGELLDKTQEREVLDKVAVALDDGRMIHNWWLDSVRDGRLVKLPVARQLRSSASNFGFVDEIRLNRGVLPVLGVSQDMLYAQPLCTTAKLDAAPLWFRSQLREYAMRYFLSLCWSRQPQMPTWNRVSLDPSEVRADRGWKWEQIYYRRNGEGTVGKFAEEDRDRIIHLEVLKEAYEWVVLKVHLNDFTLSKTLLGVNGPRLEVSMEQEVFIVISSDMVMLRESEIDADPDPDAPKVIGEYGAAWSVLPTQCPDSYLAYGPNHLVTAHELLHFRILDNGEIWAKMVFIANRPNRLFNIRPLEWSLDAANLMTFGLASPLLDSVERTLQRLALPPISYEFMFIHLADSLTGGEARRLLGISMEQLLKDVMVAHFEALYDFLLQTIQLWSRVPDWTDRDSLPGWIRDATHELPRALGRNSIEPDTTPSTHDDWRDHGPP